jgi:hypothetical protein
LRVSGGEIISWQKGSSAAVLACVLMIVPPFQRRVPSHPQGYWLAELVGQRLLSVSELFLLRMRCKFSALRSMHRRRSRQPDLGRAARHVVSSLDRSTSGLTKCTLPADGPEKALRRYPRGGNWGCARFLCFTARAAAEAAPKCKCHRPPTTRRCRTIQPQESSANTSKPAWCCSLRSYSRGAAAGR